MKTKRVTRTTEITMETTELIFAKRTTQLLAGWCASCAREVTALNFDEAARKARVDIAKLLQWIANRQLHVVQTNQGSAICGMSLEMTCSSRD